MEQEDDEHADSTNKEDDFSQNDDKPGNKDVHREQEAESLDLPLFEVEVQEAVKRGDSVMFTIHNTITSCHRGYVVLRKFEDLEWLHHNLITANNIEGIIVPPLPAKPLSYPKSAESLSRQELGDSTSVMRGDQFEQDCKYMQKYLQLMLAHETFGWDKNLEKFLTDEEPPARPRFGKSIVTRLATAFDVARKSGHKDVDEYFAEQRHFANEFSKFTKEACLNYNKMLAAQWRLSNSYRLLAMELTSCTAERDEELVKLNGILKLLSDACEDEAACYELKSGQGELTLGFFLDLLSRYSDSLKEMHFRRTNSLIEFELSEKALEKAKPPKRVIVEQDFEAAKEAYERCSEVAKKEIKIFTQLRLSHGAESLAKYAELQMKISQDFYSQLFHSKKALLEVQL